MIWVLNRAGAIWDIHIFFQTQCAYQTLFAGGRKTVLFSSRYCYCTLPLPKRFWIGLSDIRILSKCFLAIATEYRTIICIGSRRRYLQLVNMHGVTSRWRRMLKVPATLPCVWMMQVPLLFCLSSETCRDLSWEAGLIVAVSGNNIYTLRVGCWSTYD